MVQKWLFMTIVFVRSAQFPKELLECFAGTIFGKTPSLALLASSTCYPVPPQKSVRVCWVLDCNRSRLPCAPSMLQWKLPSFATIFRRLAYSIAARTFHLNHFMPLVCKNNLIAKTKTQQFLSKIDFQFLSGKHNFIFQSLARSKLPRTRRAFEEHNAKKARLPYTFN